MAKYKVDITGVNTTSIKVLTNEEMNDLFKRLKNNDIKAREELVNGNLKLVLSILKKFYQVKENKDDLFQVGCVGLLKAIDNFDPSYGVKFSTYCVPMILGEIRRFVRDNTSLRVSRSLKDLAYKINREKERLSLILGKEVTNEELAKELNISEYDLVLALESKKEPISIFVPIYNDGGDTIYLCDQIEDSQDIDVETRISVSDSIKELEDREKYIIDQRFIIGKTQVELSEELGISQAQISRIEKKALDTLKRKIQ